MIRIATVIMMMPPKTQSLSLLRSISVHSAARSLCLSPQLHQCQEQSRAEALISQCNAVQCAVCSVINQCSALFSSTLAYSEWHTGGGLPSASLSCPVQFYSTTALFIFCYESFLQNTFHWKFTLKWLLTLSRLLLFFIGFDQFANKRSNIELQ